MPVTIDCDLGAPDGWCIHPEDPGVVVRHRVEVERTEMSGSHRR
jgi:hypothetical protein